MTRPLSAREVLRALGRAGFVKVGQKGSHVRLKGWRNGRNRVVIVPMHREIAPGTMKSILRQADMDMDELQGLL